MEKQKIYKIYVLKNSESNEIRYVGVTTSTLNMRRYQHKHNALTKKSPTHVCNWIRNLYKNNLDFKIELIEETDVFNWELREKYWIEFYPNLTNISEGGKGVILNRPLEGRLRSSESHYKPVVVLDYDFNVIKELPSVNETCIFLNCPLNKKTRVSNALNGRSKTCNNFILMFKDKYYSKNFDREIYFSKRFRPIFQYSSNGELIQTHRNYSSFCIFNDIKYESTLSFNILNDKIKYNNCFWSYESPEKFSINKNKQL